MGLGNRVGLRPPVNFGRRDVDKLVDLRHPASSQQCGSAFHMDPNILLCHFEGTLYGGWASGVNHHFEPGDPGFQTFRIGQVAGYEIDAGGKRPWAFDPAANSPWRNSLMKQSTQDRRADEPVRTNQPNALLLQVIEHLWV